MISSYLSNYADELYILTTKKHFLEQVVDLGHAKELDELDLLDHLPGDALQSGQQKQQLPKPPSGVVLSVVDVVLQADLDLVAHPLDLAWVAKTFCVWFNKEAERERRTEREKLTDRETERKGVREREKEIKREGERDKERERERVGSKVRKVTLHLKCSM